MYFQKDYVLRMIEMLGELVRKICSIAREADAYKELDEISHKALGLPLSLLRTTDPDELDGLLCEPQRYLAAELIMIDIEIAKRTKTDDLLLPLKAQALSLYATLKEPDYVAPSCARAAWLLEENLGEFPAALLAKAARLLERGGAFDKAEDAWFAARDIAPDLIQEVRAFYDRLERLSDRELKAGGLSRGELTEGRAALN